MRARKTNKPGGSNRSSNSFIKQFDRFGNPASSLFNVNEQAQKHRTLPGGICTILLYITVLAFAIFKLTHLFGSRRDSERRAEIQTDLNYLKKGSLDIGDYNSKVFLRVRGYQPGKASGGKELETLNLDSSDIKKYLSIVGGRSCTSGDNVDGLPADDYFICTDVSFATGKQSWLNS